MNLLEMFGFGKNEKLPRVISAYEIPPELIKVGEDIGVSSSKPDSDSFAEIIHRDELIARASELFAESISNCTDLEELKAIGQAVREFYFAEDEKMLIQKSIERLVNVRASELFGEEINNCTDLGRLEAIGLAVKEFGFVEDEKKEIRRGVEGLISARAEVISGRRADPADESDIDGAHGMA